MPRGVKGMRFSAEAPLHGEDLVISLFYKRLRELEAPIDGAEKENDSFLGASLDLELPSGWGGSVGWLDNGRWRKGSIAYIDQFRRALVISANYRFGKNSSVQAQYQRVDGEIRRIGYKDDSLTHLYSLYFTAYF